nr:hypothetical protein [Clostridia bacterium]
MQRKDAKIENTWNANDIYESDEAWEKAADKLYAQIDFSEYVGKLFDRKVLLKYLKANDSLVIERAHRAVYADLK